MGREGFDREPKPSVVMPDSEMGLALWEQRFQVKRDLTEVAKQVRNQRESSPEEGAVDRKFLNRWEKWLVGWPGKSDELLEPSVYLDRSWLCHLADHLAVFSLTSREETLERLFMKLTVHRLPKVMGDLGSEDDALSERLAVAMRARDVVGFYLLVYQETLEEPRKGLEPELLLDQVH